jgi:hypothetical protein
MQLLDRGLRTLGAAVRTYDLSHACAPFSKKIRIAALNADYLTGATEANSATAAAYLPIEEAAQNRKMGYISA